MFRLLFMLVILISGCGTMNNDYQYKIDPILRAEINNSDEISDSVEYNFLAKVKEQITDLERKKIEETGIKIESVIKNIFTGKGRLKSINELAKLDFIIAIEKSNENELFE
ncbi:MAG: hypothetical protein CMF23_09820 [Ignavibacteriae bacterium]|nr:hypothetical protein [Ignavibacteriota bacterium]